LQVSFFGESNKGDRVGLCKNSHGKNSSVRFLQCQSGGSKVLVFKTPKKDFACETFVIKDFKKFNGGEKRGRKETEKQISGF